MFISAVKLGILTSGFMGIECFWSQPKVAVSGTTPHSKRVGPDPPSSRHLWPTSGMANSMLARCGPGLAVMAPFMLWHAKCGPIVVRCMWPRFVTDRSGPDLVSSRHFWSISDLVNSMLARCWPGLAMMAPFM